MKVLRHPRLFTAALIVATGSALLIAAPAHAATLIVDDDGRAVGTNCNTGAVGSAPTSINAAIAAAGVGNAIKVCPGTYNEAVVVNKRVILAGAKVGANGATRTFGGAAESIITTGGTGEDAIQVLVDNAVIDGFTVQDSRVGVSLSNSKSGYKVRNNIIRGNVMGVYLNSNGTLGTLIERNLIAANNSSFSDPSPASGAGNGIYSDAGVGNVAIRGNHITANLNTGMLVVNCTGGYNSGIFIRSNRFTNNYSGLALYDNNTNVVVAKNVTGDTNMSNDLQWGSTFFIGDRVTNVTIGGVDNGNSLNRAPYSGIAVRDGNPQCEAAAAGLPAGGVTISRNTVNGSGNNGIDVTVAEAGRVTVHANWLQNNGKARPDLGFSGADGIVFGSATNGNTISGNTATGSGKFDCHDLSTGGTAGTPKFGTQNSWTTDTGVTTSPAGICTP